MSGQGVRWTAEQVLALAPDASSRKSGSRLAAPGPWSEAGSGDDAVWGLCKGSGRTPYQAVVDLAGGDGPGYRCSCPSRKFPCKHALGLLLLWAGAEPCVGEDAEPPPWAAEWLNGRRARASARAAGAGATGGNGSSDGDGAAAGRGAGDPQAARRRAERRTAAITAGATELEQRLADLLGRGLAGADGAGYGEWEQTAARMVDAQAPGLAGRVRELGAVAASGPGWPDRLLAECALLHLLARGWRAAHDGRLPEPLAATVRARTGLNVDAATVLAEAAGADGSLRRDAWLVLAQRDTEEGRLTARRIWLHGRASGRPALLLAFGAAGRAPQITLPVGTVLDADLAYYPGAAPLRAALGERRSAPSAGFVPPGGSTDDALAAYGAALAEDPWLDGWPVVLRDVVPVRPAEHGGWQLADADGDTALPVAPAVPESRLWRLVALSGGGPVTVFGECGHRGFAPHTAWAPGAGETTAVPL
ncbi:SWIM zinc finger family protein [Streptomyces sp. DSM 42041]|uniref:SWIM zinc finger family protein n=1 Tax=Streptomyces hazeniae TaxID=3075538 RepID=A0ABU2NU40_9ACTN|nr:SWIM zinc finger family protein [Streptomyces sp. DSM 42041]MDT0380502.1 SWIM zinc finger family protein [Streptomyces sp. DSM 42041]